MTGLMVIGVDPGLSGAIAGVLDGDLKWVVDMPVAANEVAVPLLNELYDPDEYGPWHTTTESVVAVERVGSMPKQGVSSTFKFGKAYGTVLGYFGGRHRVIHVTPQQWKKTFTLGGKDKEAGRLLALERWPHMADRFGRKKDHGRAEAALIAVHADQLLAVERAEARGSNGVSV